MEKGVPFFWLRPRLMSERRMPVEPRGEHGVARGFSHPRQAAADPVSAVHLFYRAPAERGLAASSMTNHQQQPQRKAGAQEPGRNVLVCLWPRRPR